MLVIAIRWRDRSKDKEMITLVDIQGYRVKADDDLSFFRSHIF
jgi:hypothetical protein